jgi:uncharacterized protein with beta-barrel porin domain
MSIKKTSAQTGARSPASVNLHQAAYTQYGSAMVAKSGNGVSASGVKRLLAAALLSSSSMIVIGSPVHALPVSVCTPGMPTAGTTVTCTGATTTRESFTVDELTVIADENFDQNTTGTQATTQTSNAGIVIISTGGTVRNSGSIRTGQTTTNEGPYYGVNNGIFISGTTFNSTAVNEAGGSITVADPVGPYSRGISIGMTGTGSGEATNRGTINVTSPQGAGINIATTGSGTATVTNATGGSIVTSGAYSVGVASGAFGATATATNATGATISVTGAGSSGLVVVGRTVVGTNDGSITATGEYSRGIVGASVSAETTTLTNSGSVSVTGDSGQGILGTGPTVHLTNTSTGSVTVAGAGNGMVRGNLSIGLAAVGDTVNVTNDGTVTVNGAANTVGIFASSITPKTTNVVNTGTINVNGTGYSYGIVATGPTVNVTNSGTINHGIAAGYGTTATVINDGGTVGNGEVAIYTASTNTSTVTVSGTGNDINGVIKTDGYGVSTLSFQQTDTLNLDDGNGMNTAVGNFNTINFSAGTTVFTGTSISGRGTTANVTAGATLAAGGPSTFYAGVSQLNVSGMGTSRGTLQVPAGSTIRVTGDTTFNAGGRFRVGVASDTSAGYLNGGDGTVTFNAGSEIYADVTRGVELTEGRAIKIAGVDAGEGGTIVDNNVGGTTVYDNTVLFSFTSEVRTNSELFLITKRELRARTATESNNGTTPAESIASAIDEFIDNAPSDNPIVAYLAQFPVAEQEARLFQLVKDSLPEDSGSTGSSAISSADMVLDLIMGRLANGSLASSGGSASGMAAGEQFLGGTGNWAVWGQASASYADYDPSIINGFESDTYAISGGIDGDVADDLRLGLSVFYSKTSVDETGAGANSAQDIEGIGALLYGTYRPEAFYVNGTLGVGFNEYESARNSLGGVNRADYDGTQIISSLEFGKVFTDGNWELSPHIGARFNYIDIDGYTETGPLPTSIGSQSITSFRGLLGLSGRYTHALEDGSKLIPEGYVRALQELADPGGAVTGTVVGGGTFISQSAARENLSYALGAGATYEMDGSLSLRVLYEGEYQEDYREHSISAAVRFQF